MEKQSFWICKTIKMKVSRWFINVIYKSKCWILKNKNLNLWENKSIPRRKFSKKLKKQMKLHISHIGINRFRASINHYKTMKSNSLRRSSSPRNKKLSPTLDKSKSSSKILTKRGYKLTKLRNLTHKKKNQSSLQV